MVMGSGLTVACRLGEECAPNGKEFNQGTSRMMEVVSTWIEVVVLCVPPVKPHQMRICAFYCTAVKLISKKHSLNAGPAFR